MAQDPLKPKDDGKIKLPRVDNAMNKIPTPKRSGGKGSKGDAKFNSGEDDKDDIEDQKIILRARKRFDRCIQAEAKNRQMALEDIKFLNGDQWPADVSSQRNGDKRPCLTFNKLPTFVHQVTNAERENRPGINFSPVGEMTDRKAAKIYSGLVRFIQADSSADIAYDTAFQNAVGNGWGYWRVVTEYEGPDTFNQKLMIRRVRNPFTVYLDPDGNEPDGSDAQFGFVTEMIPNDEYKEQYPDAQQLSWTPNTTGDAYKEWVEKDRVRVAEYYEIKHEMLDLVHLSNGHTGFKDELSQDVKDQIQAGTIEILNERKAEKQTCLWYKLTALEILERTEIKSGGMIPIVRCIGDEVDEQGKVTYSGIVRYAKDAQRMYNYWRTTEAELIALQPKAPFVMEEGQVEGHETQWKQANNKPFPYLLYKATNIGGKPAPPPSRQQMTQPPTGVLQAIQGAAQDMMATTGIRFDATVAERIHDESGKAIREIRRSGDIGSFHYSDNKARALKYTGRLLMAMIPNYYDTPRIMTILREDGTEQTVKIDPHADKALTMGKTSQGKALPIFNPNVGKYGVAVTVGPSYATKRIEAADQMFQFISKMPDQGRLVADLIAKNMDWPEADQFAARLAKALPPNLLTPANEDMDPQIQALIQSQQMQLQQLNLALQQANKQLQDQTADRLLMADKTTKDFEAKVLGVVQKMMQADQKANIDHSSNVVGQTLDFMRLLQPRQPEPVNTETTPPQSPPTNGFPSP